MVSSKFQLESFFPLQNKIDFLMLVIMCNKKDADVHRVVVN